MADPFVKKAYTDYGIVADDCDLEMFIQAIRKDTLKDVGAMIGARATIEELADYISSNTGDS